MPETIFQRPCPVCGALHGDILEQLNFAVFDDETLPGSFNLVVCRDCGHCFYGGRLKPAQVDEHYRRNRYYATSFTPGAGGESEADRRHHQQIIDRVRPWLPPGFDRPVYDVGCGRGGLLKALSAAGFRHALGVELLPEAVELIRAGGFTALEGSALRLPVVDQAPGLVIYSHVFEHLLDPAEALNEARRRLAPGGLVYIEVPDASCYEASIPWRALYLEHLGHFALPDLECLLLRAGFEVVALERGKFPLARGRSEEVIWAVACLGGHPITGSPKTDPGQPAAALCRYLHDCRVHPLMKKVAFLAASGRPLKVWGLSQMTLLLLGSSPLAQADLRGFIDSDPSKRARRLWGRAVEGPESLSGDQSGDELLLAAWGAEGEMLDSLKTAAFKGVVHSLTSPSSEVGQSGL